MREILFRGKRTVNDEWLEGGVVCWKHGEVYITGFTDASFDSANLYMIIERVIPKTVGQYTGLTDKNGKKIFEGDIVAGAVHWLERMKNGVVAFRDGSFGLLWYRGDVEQFNAFTSMCNVEYEIIGNIHDNPELLKGE